MNVGDDPFRSLPFPSVYVPGGICYIFPDDLQK